MMRSGLFFTARMPGPALRALLLGLLLVLGQGDAFAAPPQTAEFIRQRLDALPAGQDYRDPTVYAATKAELAPKVQEAKQFPDRAESILKNIYFDLIRFSPIQGYDPVNNARTAAAFEAYLEIMDDIERRTAPPPTPAATPPAPAPASNPAIDDHARTAVEEIIRDATSGGVIDPGRLIPGISAPQTSTITGPTVSTPTVRIPSVATPHVTAPTVRVPTVATPHVNAPTVRVPTVAAPRINVPTVRAPRVNESTITGLKSGYLPVTRADAQAIVGKYKSIPGGVTLEGASSDLSFIKNASYVAWANAFVLNGNIIYLNPVSAQEFAEIYRALLSDDKLGVSLGSMAIVYGALPPQSDVAINLQLADKFLGDIAFGRREFVRGYVFAPGYTGATVKNPTNLAVYFMIRDFRFAQDAEGQLARSGASFDMTLVPLSAALGPDGGHLPDFSRIDKGDVPKEYVANLKHLQDNIDYYARERIIRTVIAYGEAAAFVRALKSNGVKLDLGTIVKDLPPAKDATIPTASSSGGDSCALASAHWTSAESIGTRVAYEDHLDRFPGCAFATLAQARIAALDQKSGSRAKVAPRKAERRTASPRQTTPSGGGNPGIECNTPTGIMVCVNRAISNMQSGR
jgi:hypothetical protein